MQSDQMSISKNSQKLSVCLQFGSTYVNWTWTTHAVFFVAVRMSCHDVLQGCPNYHPFAVPLFSRQNVSKLKKNDPERHMMNDDLVCSIIITSRQIRISGIWVISFRE